MSSMSSAALATRPARRTAAQTREHLLAVAQRLFYWEGIRATGVDRVAQVAQVAPTVLYRAFGSKDGLVAAYVRANATAYKAFIEAQTGPDRGTASERILRLFESVLVQVQPEVCRGCPFLMALSEFPDSANEAHQLAVATKQWVRDHLHSLVEDLAREDRAEGVVVDADTILELTDQLTLVLEGVYASVQALTAAGPPRQARSAATVLIDAFSARVAS
jgi:AcrR family transcriptional regulator